MSWNVAAVMTRNVETVGPGCSYKDVVECLRTRHVSAVPVVDSERRVIGVVSEADLLLKEERPDPGLGGPLLHPHGDAARALARSAAALMTTPAVTVRPEATLTEAARLMHRKHVKRLPVVDGEGRLVGIVSRADLLQPFLRSDESIAGEVREDMLRHTLAIDPAAVTVTVADGVVRLEGQVETKSLAGITAHLVQALEGVVAVESRLTWKWDDTHVDVPTNPLALRYSVDERP